MDELPPFERRMSEMSGEITTGELARRMDRSDRLNSDNFAELKRMIASLHYVPMDLYQSETKVMQAEILDLKSRYQWAIRFAVSSVISAVISLTIVFVSARGG